MALSVIFLTPETDSGKTNNQQASQDGSFEGSAAGSPDENSADEKETNAEVPIRLKIYVDPEIPTYLASRLISCFKKSFDDYIRENIPVSSGDNLQGSSGE